jgi:hypothetical protein
MVERICKAQTNGPAQTTAGNHEVRYCGLEFAMAGHRRLLLLMLLLVPRRPSGSRHPPYREPAARLIGGAAGSPFAWQRLSALTDSIGNRLMPCPS